MIDPIRFLLDMDPVQYRDEWPSLTEERLLAWFEWANAFWFYEGDPLPDKPHAELTSGLCSNGYFNCPALLAFPNATEVLGRQLAIVLQSHGIGKVDWVVSSSYSAITFGHEVAKALHARFGYTEKDPQDAKRQIWNRFEIPKGARVLQIEELITTRQTTREVRRAVEAGNPDPIEFLPLIGTLVLRPANLAAEKAKGDLVALVEKEIWAKKPEECLLCKVGSPRYKPKAHWAELTGR